MVTRASNPSPGYIAVFSFRAIFYGDPLLTGVNKCLWGHNSVNSSSITVNDSLDCSYRPYGHGAKIRTIKNTIFWPRYCEKYEKFPVNFCNMIRPLPLLTKDLGATLMLGYQIRTGMVSYAERKTTA